MQKIVQRTVVIPGIVAAAVCLLVAPSRLVPAAWSQGQGTVVDRVVAIVEDDAIFESDVDQGVKQVLLQRGAGAVSESGKASVAKEVLDELIKNKLVLAKASKLGITVSFAEVEKAVDRAIEENKKVLGGEQAFTRQLAAEGLTVDSLRKLYREQIQNRMLVERVLAREIDRSSVAVTEEALRSAYEERKTSFPERPAVVHLATIVFGFESSEAARSKAKALIDSLRARIVAGEDFGTIAKAHSEDPSGNAGGSLGKLKLADLGNRAFADAAAKLAVGELSEPVLTPFGYHLIQVTAADTTTGEVDLRHILIRVKPEDRDMQEVFETAEDVRRRLIAGEPFDSMAVRYSTDASSAPAGGDLGWLRVSDLPEFFREVLKDLTSGDVSQVLREPSGFRIVKLLEREEARPYTFDEVRDELKQAMEEEALDKMYNSYLDKLRTEFYVEVRPQ